MLERFRVDRAGVPAVEIRLYDFDNGLREVRCQIREPTEVRGQHDVVEPSEWRIGSERLFREYIQSRRPERSLGEDTRQRSLVYDGAARGVDEHAVRSDTAQSLLVQEPATVLGKLELHGDDVGLLE